MGYNYAIGIGGTGARLMEALVRLCECGYLSLEEGENEITCLLVDADTSNGNALKTQEVIKKYKECQKYLGNDPKRKIFATKLTGINDCHFAKPFSEDDLKADKKIDIISLARESSDPDTAISLVKRHYKDSAFNEDLRKGLYGMPSVGTFIFSYYSDKSPIINDLLKQIVNQANQIDGEEKIRIFIAGSVFGGTGASGLPYLSKAIHRKVNEAGENLINRLEIFGCLMLPYFKHDGTGTDGKINQDRFDMVAHEAMDDYIKLMENNVFKKIYLIGDTSMPVRGGCCYAGSPQKNMPHISELFAASQARAFFTGTIDEMTGKSIDYVDPFNLQGNTINNVTWGDCRIGASGKLQKFVEDFILFNYYYSMYIIPLMFNFHGSGAEYLKLYDEIKKTSIENQKISELRKMKLLDRFWKKGRGWLGWLGWFSKKKFAGWRNELILTEAFIHLFKYMTDSATWYYGLIHEYNKNEKICSECEESTSCKKEFPEAKQECINSKVKLPELFRVEGAEMLKERSFFPKWLETHKENSEKIFLDKCKTFSKDIAKKATLGNKKSKNIILRDIRQRQLDATNIDSYYLFRELISELYAAISEPVINEK